MKLLPVICLLFLTQFSLKAQTTENTSEKFLNANADASVTVTDKSILEFFTTEELTLGTLVIPTNSRFTATVNMIGGRAYLRVSSIKIRDEIHTVNWRVVGKDYKEGIPYVEADQSFEIYADERFTFKVFQN